MKKFLDWIDKEESACWLFTSYATAIFSVCISKHMSGSAYAFAGFIGAFISYRKIKDPASAVDKILWSITLVLGIIGFFVMIHYPHGGTPVIYKPLYLFSGQIMGLIISGINDTIWKDLKRSGK